jgi:hypothetical protein
MFYINITFTYFPHTSLEFTVCFFLHHSLSFLNYVVMLLYLRQHRRDTSLPLGKLELTNPILTFGTASPSFGGTVLPSKLLDDTVPWSVVYDYKGE